MYEKKFSSHIKKVCFQFTKVCLQRKKIHSHRKRVCLYTQNKPTGNSHGKYSKQIATANSSGHFPLQIATANSHGKQLRQIPTANSHGTFPGQITIAIICEGVPILLANIIIKSFMFYVLIYVKQMWTHVKSQVFLTKGMII